MLGNVENGQSYWSKSREYTVLILLCKLNSKTVLLSSGVAGRYHLREGGCTLFFLLDNGAFTWSPLKYMFCLSPHIDGGRFHDPSPLSQPPQKASVNICFLTHIPISWSFITALFSRCMNLLFDSKQGRLKWYLLEHTNLTQK